MASKEAEYAWAAGMFEGEGSVRCRRKQSYYVHKTGERSTSETISIELKITSTYLHPLELFNDIFDGAGNIHSCDPNDAISKKTTKLWKLRYDLVFSNYKSVKDIYTNMEYWLSPRRKDQCETALTMFEINAKRGR